MNLKHNGGISDLNHPPHFSRRVHSASRLTQTSSVIFIGNDEEPTRGITPQFDGQAFQHVLKGRKLR
jgi:hypothetical protein